MIGNDLVDLLAREAAGKSGDARFVKRVFTEREAELIAGSASPDTALWLLWAAKEAAYKVAKKLAPDVIFAHSRYEVVPDSPSITIEPLKESSPRSGRVLLRGVAGLDGASFPVEWTATASYVHCVAVDVGRDFRALRVAIAGRDDLGRTGRRYELTERERASLPAARSADSLAVRRLARALATEAGIGEVEIVREWSGSTLGPPRLYPLGGAIPIPGWDITLSHDGGLVAAALGEVGTTGR